MLQLFPLDLQQGPAAALVERIRDEISPPLAAVAGRFARAFIIDSPWAPGFCCIGAELLLEPEAVAAYGAPRLSVAGNGESLEAALVSCLGEAADRLAVVERPGDVSGPARPATNTLIDTWIAKAVASAGALDWIEARDIITARPLELPADLCLRRRPERRRFEPAGALSAGVAAGADWQTAALRAALELCERDAAALWWLGGRRPTAFPLEHPATVAGTTLIAALRQGSTERRTMLADITSDLGIPTVAAVSLDCKGRGLACGLAARLDWAEAARAAVLEMCQMELAAPLATAKLAERGEAALNDADRHHLQRASFAASDCMLIYPCGVSAPPPQASTAPHDLRAFGARLASNGVRLFVLDLTRPDIGVAVARVVSPDLQPYNSGVVTDRLWQCRADYGGAHLATSTIPLM